MDLNKAARRAYNNALARGKVTKAVNHEETVSTLSEEFEEMRRAGEEESSEHLREYTEMQEELADIIIGSMTELMKRGTDIEMLLHRKLKFNEARVKDSYEK